MNTLFELEPLMPEGFTYIPDFISTSEELELIGDAEKTQLHTFRFQGYEAKRKVASFGYDWSFSERQLSQGSPIPDVFSGIIIKVATCLKLQQQEVAELLVTEYPAGSVINWHRDAPPFELIAGLSLASDCIFRFRPYNKDLQNRKSVLSQTVKRRSLYIMQGPSRSEWEHSISPVKSLRYSITFRTLKKPEVAAGEQPSA